MLLTLSFVSVLALAPPADSISGAWRITGDVMGNPVNEVCTIRQEGTALSGSCVMQGSGEYELTGESKDGRITFRHGGVYEGEALTIVYTGTLVSATELRGTIHVMPFDAGGGFTATPVSP